MKKTLIILFIVNLFIFSPLFYMAYEAKKYEKRIGKQYVLVKDTVTIVGFNYWNNTYQGSDGKDYSRIFVESVEEMDEMRKIK